MQWKMSEQSLFAILLRSPWWISAAIGGGLAALGVTLLREEWRIYGVFMAAPFVVIAGIALWRQLKAPSSRRVAATLDTVRAMHWNDFSAALEIAKAGRRALVSGKRWKVARTGVEPLRELDGAKAARDAHECIYVVAGELTEQARAFAAKKRIRLIGGVELATLVPEAPAARRR